MLRVWKELNGLWRLIEAFLSKDKQPFPESKVNSQPHL